MAIQRMNWDRLISDKRLGLEHYHDDKGGGVRSDFERDYDRLVFSSPFRRLQNKTQVFPLPDSIFVHNRLTHSLEVSSVGKSMAREIVMRLMPRYKFEPWIEKLRDIREKRPLGPISLRARAWNSRISSARSNGVTLSTLRAMPTRSARWSISSRDAVPVALP